MTSPALISVGARLDVVRTALLGLGAVADDQWSVALNLGEDLLVLAYDQAELSTTIAVGGEDPLASARWIAAQLEGPGCVVEELLAPTDLHEEPA